MNLSNVPWALVIFCLTQIGLLIGFGFWVKYSIKSLNDRVQAIEKEHSEIKRELRELRETLLLVKHSVDLMVLGQLKTSKNKEAA